MDLRFNRRSGKLSGILALFLIPALCLPACTRKRETTTVTGRVTRVDTSTQDGPLTFVVTSDAGEMTVLHVTLDPKNGAAERTKAYQTAQTLRVGNRVEAVTTHADNDYQVQTITVTSTDTVATDVGALDTGRTPMPPVRATPAEVRVSDAGQTFTYHVGDKFTLLLDGNSYPQAQLSFAPGGVITLDSDAPPATAPNYAAQFEAVAPGEVVLKNGTFTVTIRVVS
ncbi:MAG TPA: hypothetical protein VE910_03555 [Dongiaceae bacterium]|nr:hypothetical protein [Dongiaceae bacterium]